jgi:hypothetical protein
MTSSMSRAKFRLETEFELAAFDLREIQNLVTGLVVTVLGLGYGGPQGDRNNKESRRSC